MTTTPASPHLRIARPTNDLAATARLYRDGLGLEELGAFEDHEGFDGVMLGGPGLGWHLELTHERGHPAPRCPSPEHLLVLYLPDPAAHAGRCAAMEAAGFLSVVAHNPYWERRGRTFEDPEGYRVVVALMAWPA